MFMKRYLSQIKNFFLLEIFSGLFLTFKYLFKLGLLANTPKAFKKPLLIYLIGYIETPPDFDNFCLCFY